MREIKLTQGKVARVDDEDFEWLNQWKWFAHQGHGPFYAGRGTFVDGKRGHIWMHRQIMDAPMDMVIDHIDHDGLNNQKSNLRICSRGQNVQNSRRSGSLGFKGVSYFYKKKKKRFRATIYINGKNIFLGLFYTPEEAARVYDRNAVKYFGDFAWLNFPEEKDERLREIEML